MSYTNSRWEWILKYIDYGWSTIPVLGKLPLIPWKPYQSARASIETWKNWVDRFPHCGVGLVTGEISGVYGVDLDSLENERKFLEMIEGFPETPSYKTSRGTRYLFQSKLNINSWKSDVLELFGTGGQIVLPPSIHPSGCDYKWNKYYSPEDVRFETLPKILESNTSSIVTVASDKETECIKESSRNNTLFKYAGALLRVGVPIEDIRKCLDIFNKRCDPQLEAKELDLISNSVDRYRKITK